MLGALDRPCVGIGTLEALAASVGPAELVVAAIDGGRGRLYLQAFADGAPSTAPDGLEAGDAAARLAELYRGGGAVLVGPGAPLLAGVIANARIDPRPAPDCIVLATLAAARREPLPPPRPLYLRPADARTLAERAAAAP